MRSRNLLLAAAAIAIAFTAAGRGPYAVGPLHERLTALQGFMGNAAITSLFLMHYGTGPVKGFAVTLLTGVFTSMFTAVFVTRTLVDLLVDKVGLKKLSV